MKKALLALAVVAAAVMAFAVSQNSNSSSCCPAEKGAQAKVAKTEDCATMCEAGKVAKTAACCAEKGVQAKVAKTEDCTMCEAGKAAKPAKAEACCASGDHKMVMKGGEGCCNAPGQFAKFKIFVDGKYMYYGCKDSAMMAHKELKTMAFKVGSVQPVSGKVRIPKNQSLI